jgi:uncharacterized membrane protein YtjA (UPF0391 family)
MASMPTVKRAEPQYRQTLPSMRVQSKFMASAHRGSVPARRWNKEAAMLYYTIVFFVIALIAAFFGFSGIAAGAVSIAKILFFVFLIMAIVSLLLGRRSPPA